MIKKKSKAFLCAIVSIGFINSIQIIDSNAMSTQNINLVKFSDTNGHWAESEINKFSSLGYIGGYEDGSFKPNNSITRAEFVKILDNAFGLTESSGRVFSDTQDHWAQKYIDIAVTNEVCKGKSDTHFEPDCPITREEAAVMISNYDKLKNNNSNYIIKEFSDKDDVSEWAKDGVDYVVEKGYMNGYTDNIFKPKSNITRAEAVSTLSRVNEAELKANQEEASLNKINNAIELIHSIPGEIYKIDECTDDQVRQEFMQYKEQVNKADEAYNSLNDEEKKSVTYFDLAILNKGKIMVSQLEEVNANILKGKNLVDRINALETYSQYKESDEIKAIIKEIKDLRSIYESLLYNIQLVIPQDTKHKLFKAEEALLVYNIQQEEANKVIAQIN